MNEAREKTEKIIDILHEPLKGKRKKVRTYREEARKDYLSVSKKRKPTKNRVRKGIRKQLQYINRNLRYIRELREETPLTNLDKSLYRDLLVISEVYRQQKQMYEEKMHRIDDRIVSISQPYIRPIVRGKAKASVEFGAKISVSLVEGYAFMEELSWDAYNEGTLLIEHIEKYKKRFGYYPESVHADTIYRNRDNRSYCKGKGIRLSGPPLGRPPKDTEKYREVMGHVREDEIARIPIEGVFGRAKRRYGWNRIMAKTRITSETAISMTVLVMNLEKTLRDLLLLFFRFLKNFLQNFIIDLTRIFFQNDFLLFIQNY